MNQFKQLKIEEINLFNLKYFWKHQKGNKMSIFKENMLLYRKDLLVFFHITFNLLITV